ncbi:hypothetical protein [Paracoccus litorisediminis]|uniref:Uncharacterized protein n=1 Tax=Paracoccus litorisediminis TaxID=2006130 RepID=A0A844HS02_9RHOB|nr:hypothetical protein [Paracoccus litorisediminis]MTH61214.1 hypothetical protein [Paracoccus litorisediminis]
MDWLLGNSQWLNGRGPNLRSASAESRLAQVLAGGSSLEILWPHPKYWFQDVAGTRPVTAAGQPIRCWKTISGTMRFIQPTSDDRAPVAARMPNGNWVAYFDGVDDGLQSDTNLDWSINSYGMVMAGLRKLGADGTTQCAIEQGPQSSASDGWSIFGPVGTSQWRAYSRQAGSAGGSSVTEGTYSGDNTSIVSALLDGVVGRVYLRVAGIQRGYSSGPTAGALVSDKVNLGCRDMRNTYFNGYIGPVVMRSGPHPNEAALVAADALINDHLLGTFDRNLRQGARGATTLIADPRYWFQDAAGTIPVTTVGQPIRCWVSTNGRKFIQPTSDDRAPTASILPNGQWSVFFDGVDDYLVSERNVPFGDSSAIALFAGVRKLSDGYINAILFKGSSSNNGYIELSGQRSFLAGLGTSKYGVQTRGDTGAVSSGFTESSWGAQLSAPHSAVLSATLEPTAVARGVALRTNGVAANMYNNVGGVATYASEVVHIGCTSALNYNFHGHITHLGMRMGVVAPEATIIAAENIINQHLGAF